MGWGALSLGRGAAGLPRGQGQNWKPVSGHTGGSPRAVAWAGETSLHLERPASSIPTRQGSFMSPPSPSPWPAGSWWGLTSCPDAMLSMSQPRPRHGQRELPGGTWSRGRLHEGLTVPVERGYLAHRAAPVLRTQICPTLIIRQLSPVANRAPCRRVSGLYPATSRWPTRTP